jgi:hypothetical protein
MFMFIMFDSQEKLVEKNYYLHQPARDAYRSYLLAYNSHAMKDIFNVHRLDLQVQFLILTSNQICQNLVYVQF